MEESCDVAHKLVEEHLPLSVFHLIRLEQLLFGQILLEQEHSHVVFDCVLVVDSSHNCGPLGDQLNQSQNHMFSVGLDQQSISSGLTVK